uniref:WGS project CAEQ00000000 data, annotated contig 26 n=1 Tax=Trypanosoma congolense (strain IL3000) TaxID=1068625 RepID=F9WEG6_TRYCI|nr:unnamed protein product [Trypanosoma congolense IL3000]
MSYLRPTASSRRRARTPDGKDEQNGSRSSGAGRMIFAFGSLFRSNAKKRRLEGSTVARQKEEMRLSQELTVKCDAAIERASLLLNNAMQKEQDNNQLLRESSSRFSSHHASVSPKRGLPTLSPRERTSADVTGLRASERLSTPLPRVPPPTPEQTDNTKGSPTAESAVGWVGKLFRRSTGSTILPEETSSSLEAKDGKSPVEADRAGTVAVSSTRSLSPAGRRSARLSETPKSASPGRPRKSVTFRKGGNAEFPTPTRPTRSPRLVDGEEEDMNVGEGTQLPLPPALTPPLVSPAPKKPRLGSSSGRSSQDRTVSPGEVATRDVGAVIREKSSSRAFSELSKKEILAYIRQHHISVKNVVSKKQLFEMAQRIASGEADNNMEEEN